MWTDQFHSMLMLMVMSALLRASYEMSRPKLNPEEVSAFAETHSIIETPKPAAITPQQKEWAEKAAQNYTRLKRKSGSDGMTLCLSR